MRNPDLPVLPAMNMRKLVFYCHQLRPSRQRASSMANLYKRHHPKSFKVIQSHCLSAFRPNALPRSEKEVIKQFTSCALPCLHHFYLSSDLWWDFGFSLIPCHTQALPITSTQHPKTSAFKIIPQSYHCLSWRERSNTRLHYTAGLFCRTNRPGYNKKGDTLILHSSWVSPFWEDYISVH